MAKTLMQDQSKLFLLRNITYKILIIQVQQSFMLSQCTPHWGALEHFFPTHLTVNISKCIQDPLALESLKCRYYTEAQTGTLVIPDC